MCHLVENLGKWPGRLMSDALEVFDIFQLFQAIEDGFLDEVVHHHPVCPAVAIESLLEGAVDSSVDLYRRHCRDSPPE